MTDEDGFRIEAAVQFGFEWTNDDADEYACTEAQLIAFAKAAERKGRAEAIKIAEDLYGEGPSAPWDNGGTSDGWNIGTQKVVELLTALNAAIDVELAPILAAEEERFMISRGYVRGTDEPGKRWVKPSEKDTQVSDCEVCGGDCAAANPPVMNCPRDECARRGIDPDELCADGGVTAEMVVAKEIDAGCGQAVITPWQTPAPCGGQIGSTVDLPLMGETANDQGEVRAFKWFDPQCREDGCQSLVWKNLYEDAVKGRADFRAAYRKERNRVAFLEAQLKELQL